jgi:hypothetical protein
VFYIVSIGEASNLIDELELIDSALLVIPTAFVAMGLIGSGDRYTTMDWVDFGFLRPSHALALSCASSVLVNIIVTGSIAFRVMRARRRWSKLKSDLVDLQSVRTISETTILTILFEAALPPAILGVFVCALSLVKVSVYQPTYTHSVRTLWMSLTVSRKSEFFMLYPI